MKSADLIVSRAGAASLYEIVALQIPSIIIPSPNVANNHQFYNAVELRDKGVIQMVKEADFASSTMLNSIKTLLNDKEQRAKMIQNMKEISVMDSSLIIYQEIKDMIR